MSTLVIKSASLERLDSFMDSAGNNEEVTILTHQTHAGSIKANYQNASVAVYPFDSGFNPKNAKATQQTENRLTESYDKVIVLISNLSGHGHIEAIRAAFAFKGKAIYLYNINGNLIPVPENFIQIEFFKRIALYPAVIFATLLAWVVTGVILGFAAALRTIGALKNRKG